MTSVATLAMSAALFARRAKSGWLDELDGIRGDALTRPGGGVDEAMADPDPDVDPDPDPDVDVAPPRREPDASPLASLEAPLLPAGVDPSPHPSRPEEMWHPAIELGPAITPSPPAHAVSDVAAADAAEDPSGRFSFARLRSVLPSSDQNEPALSDAPVAPGGGRPSLLSELVAQYATPEEAEHVAPSGRGFGEQGFEVPMVPATAASNGQPLISGPVQRRAGGGTAAEGRRDLPVLAVDHPAPAAERVTPEATLLPEPEPEPEPEPAGPVPFSLDADGTVDLAHGHLRFSTPPAEVPRGGPDGVQALLTEGWCWISTGTDRSAGVSVRFAASTLRVEPSTTALVALESDGAAFVVVASGEATLQHPETRLHLRRGAMVLSTVAGEPQVDMATHDEIAADPLVAQNRELDLAR